MAIGSADGKLHMFDLTSDCGYRCLFELDVGQLLQKYRNHKETPKAISNDGPSFISSQPSWQKQVVSDDEKESALEPGTTVLGVCFIRNQQQPCTEENTSVALHKVLFGSQSGSAIKDVFHVPSIVAIATTAAVLLLNCNSREPLYVLDFQEPVLSSNELDEIQYNISTPGSFAFAERPNGSVTCVIGSLFQNTVNVVNIRIPTSNKEVDNATEVLSQRFSQSVGLSSLGNQDEETSATRGAEMATNSVTVLSNSPLCSNSPLRAELVPKTTAKQQQQKNTSQKGIKTGVRDQPLTFNSRVKSSGYTAATPRSKMFSPNTSLSKPKTSTVSLKKTTSTSTSSGVTLKEYPVNSEAPTNLHFKIPLTDKPTPINSVVFAGDGKHIACALANKSAHMLRPPPSTKETVFTGHDGSVTSVSFSHDSRWLLTSSCDRTVRLWSPTHSDPLMVFSSVNHNFVSELDSSAKAKDNPPFGKEILQAKFYYVDKFVLLACGNGLHLYKYHIDAGQKDDVKRYQTNNKYKLVKIFHQERAQNITCFSAINGFHSYIVLCCGSNKSIQVFDVNAARTVRVVLDAHSRPAHTIHQNEGSMFVSHPPNAYDLFLTAAVGDGIKLWDLRTNRCVRRYDGHVNRSQPVGVAISPCARFIATGSEDRSAYLYDIRGNTFCHRLTGHTDVVSSVVFNPAQPQLVTASLDGRLRFYSDQVK